MKTWLKWGFIGIVLGFIYLILSNLIKSNFCMFTSENCGLGGVAFLFSLFYNWYEYVFILIIFLLIGALIGWIIGKIKSKNQT
jgi:NADH:ubiquinone oxidoreductase subunit 6 (subunit J)|tara:strand:+ start:207 stop:455 length:249 start_codon:yes stop_codon:yes gene_type:complete